MKAIQTLALATAALAFGLPSIAAPTTVGFTEFQAAGFTRGAITDNVEAGGYRFSPECHMDLIVGGPAGFPAFADGAGIGWDISGCGTMYNEKYLGVPSGLIGGGRLYIDRGGNAFDLVSFIAQSTDAAGSETLFTSSKGGSQRVNLSYDGFTDFSFSGDLWQGVTWVMATNGGGGPSWWMDSITFATVPEPLTISLVLVAVAGATTARRCTRR
jgi:hypothetical protein